MDRHAAIVGVAGSSVVARAAGLLTWGSERTLDIAGCDQ